MQGDDGKFRVDLQKDGSAFNVFDVLTHRSGSDSSLIVFLRVNNATLARVRSAQTQTLTFDVRL